jgi:hypothetical protein
VNTSKIYFLEIESMILIKHIFKTWTPLLQYSCVQFDCLVSYWIFFTN